MKTVSPVLRLAALLLVMLCANLSKALDETPLEVATVMPFDAANYVQLSNGRWVTISGHAFYLGIFNSSFYVTTSYAASGDLNVIPISEFHASYYGSYHLQHVDAPGQYPAGYPGVYRFYDGQTGRDFDSNGSLYLDPYHYGSHFFVEYDQWRTVGLVSCNGCWVCAEDGWLQPLYANRSAQGSWETFTLYATTSNWLDRVTGTIQDGDTFALRTTTYGVDRFIAAETGGADYVIANRFSAGAWEHFTINKVGGSGPISSGDSVSILAQSSNKYWCAELGGGSIFGANEYRVRVNANRTNVGAWETFTINIQ